MYTKHLFAILTLILFSACVAPKKDMSVYREPKNICDRGTEYMICDRKGRYDKPTIDSCRCMSKRIVSGGLK